MAKVIPLQSFPFFINRIGLDPLIEKEKKEQLEIISKSIKVGFEFCALSYIESHRPTWKNEKHFLQSQNTLKTYALPIIGNLPVDQIETSLVIKIIEPIWMNKTETASRIRNRIELVLSWAD